MNVWRWRRIVPLLLVLATGCGSGTRDTEVPPAESRSAPAALQPVALPDLSKVEAQLRQRLESQQAALAALQRLAGSSGTDLAQAFGELGRLCLAADFPAAAAPYFLNARQLAPNEFRWAYYLGQAYRLQNDPARARSALEAAVALRPEDAPARTWLGRLLIDDGRAADAVPHLEAAVRVDGQSAAARFELGRAALAQQRFADAVAHFEAALTLDPGAAGAHYPLAAAYRGLKDETRAAEHARLWRQGDVVPVDPLMEEVGRLVRTSLDFAVRGTRALDARKWAEAAVLFREGLKLAPNDAALHVNLGTALYLSGDAAAALREFEHAARVSPGYARAHFNAGVLLEESGRDSEALARFARAVELDPTLVDARFSLAEAQRRAGQVEPALAHYRAIVEADPSASQARFALAIALVRLGRYAEARGVLEDGVKAYPDQAGFPHALARVLAAAPDAAVRDGGRAARLVAGLRRSFQSAALTETAAMSAAAVGNFQDAATLQRAVIEEARRGGPSDRLPWLEANLRRYEQRQTAPQPWADDDPVHRPRNAPGVSGAAP